MSTPLAPTITDRTHVRATLVGLEADMIALVRKYVIVITALVLMNFLTTLGKVSIKTTTYAHIYNRFQLTLLVNTSNYVL